jgi:hypothetical protein
MMGHENLVHQGEVRLMDNYARWIYRLRRSGS